MTAFPWEDETEDDGLDLGPVYTAMRDGLERAHQSGRLTSEQYHIGRSMLEDYDADDYEYDFPPRRGIEDSYLPGDTPASRPPRSNP